MLELNASGAKEVAGDALRKRGEAEEDHHLHGLTARDESVEVLQKRELDKAKAVN